MAQGVEKSRILHHDEHASENPRFFDLFFVVFHVPEEGLTGIEVDCHNLFLSKNIFQNVVELLDGFKVDVVMLDLEVVISVF